MFLILPKWSITFCSALAERVKTFQQLKVLNNLKPRPLLGRLRRLPCAFRFPMTWTQALLEQLQLARRVDACVYKNSVASRPQTVPHVIH